MKEIILLTITTGLTFLIFVVTFIFGFIKKSRQLKTASLFVLIVFIGLAGWTVFTFVNKSYNKVADTFKSRTGNEIYDALFDKRKSDCVKVLN